MSGFNLNSRSAVIDDSKTNNQSWGWWGLYKINCGQEVSWDVAMHRAEIMAKALNDAGYSEDPAEANG